MNDVLIEVALGLVAVWIGSIEWRLRRTLQMPTKIEVESLIDLKLEVIKSLLSDEKEDIKELKVKLDSIEALIRHILTNK